MGTGWGSGQAHWTPPLYDMALGDIEGSLGHVRAALEERSFFVSRRAFNLIAGRPFLAAWRSAIHWVLGRWDEARADARDAASIAARLTDDPVRSLCQHAGTAGLYVARRREEPEVVRELGPSRRWAGETRALPARG